jgi:PIN domain nuclease of toxin-antitoxin system
MIVDASALLAILLSEPERTALEEKLARGPLSSEHGPEPLDSSLRLCDRAVLYPSLRKPRTNLHRIGRTVKT